MTRALRWLFEDRTRGGIVIAQMPNVAMWIVLATLALSFAVPSGRAAVAARVVLGVSLTIWALDEMIRGVNPWRRFLGASTLVGVTVWLMFGALGQKAARQALVGLAWTTTAVAAEPTTPSAGGLPEKMPFDIPYGAPIGLDQAQKLVAAAKAEAEKRGWKLNIAVVDTHGDLVAFARMDGAMLASISIAQRKARTAARFRRETRVFFEATEKGHSYPATLDPDVVASPGGIPLVVDGKLIGAIGCSGGTGDQDAAVCGAAVAQTR